MTNYVQQINDFLEQRLQATNVGGFIHFPTHVNFNKNERELITKVCIRCDKEFEYGDMNKSFRGQMTRKYCDQCKVLQHRDESRLYQRRNKQ